MTDQTTRIEITANASQARREFEGFAATVQATSRVAIGAVGGMREQILGLHGRATALATVLAGSVFARLIQGAADSAGKLHDVSQQTGMAVEALSGLVAVGKTSETSLEAIAAASNRLSANMSKQGEESAGAAAALRDMGIDYNAFVKLSPEQRMLAVAKAMAGFADGAGKTAAAISLFGKQGAELLPFLADLAEIEELQVKLTKEQAAAADAYGDNLTTLRNNGTAWQRTLTNAMLPALRDASQAFLETLTATGGLNDQVKALAANGSIDRWTRQAVVGLTYLIDGAAIARRALVTLGETTGAAMAQGAAAVSGMVEAFARIGKADFSGAMDAMRQAYSRMTAMGNAWLQDQKATWSGDLLGERIRASMLAATDAAQKVKPTKPQLNHQNSKAPTGDDKAPKSRMSDWEAQLAEQKAALTRQGMVEDQYREMSKADELRYWAELKALRNLSAEERTALARKTAEAELATIRDAFEIKVRTLQAEAEQYRSNIDARIAIEQRIQAMYAQGTKQYEEAERRIQGLRRQSAEQDRQLREMRLQAEGQARLQEIAVAAQAIEEAQALGLLSQQQVLQAQMVFERQRTAVAAQGLQERLLAAQADPDRNPIELQRIQTEIEQLEQQHQLRMGQLRSTAAVDNARNINDTLGTVQSGWASLLRQLSSGTLTIGGFIKGVFATVGQAVVQTLAQMVAQWAVQKIAMLVLGNTTALGEITALSAKAGAGGVASMAAAPYPLNLGAPFFGAAMASAAMGFAPMVAAAKGYDIPAGVNPMVQAHQREMILPANLADTVRDMSAVYAQGRSTGSADAGPAVEMRVVPMPSDFWMVHRNDLHRALARANKDKFR